MVSDSTALQQAVIDIRRRTQALTSGLSAEQLMRRPDPAKWSIGECLTHLNMTAALYQPRIADAIEQAKKDKVCGKGPFSAGAIGSFLIWIAEPPVKVRLPAPKQIAPRLAHGDPAEIIAEFMKHQDEWERLIRDSEGLDQKKVKVKSPIARFPTLRLAVPIPWLLAHQRRHLAQAENVKTRLEKIG
jgi:hypothetical protein